MSDLQDVYNEWQNNPEFKKEFDKNPEKALKEAGIELSPDDLRKIQSMLQMKKQKVQDEELDKKINK